MFVRHGNRHLPATLPWHSWRRTKSVRRTDAHAFKYRWFWRWSSI